MTKKTEEVGIPRVGLHAGGYDIDELERALKTNGDADAAVRSAVKRADKGEDGAIALESGAGTPPGYKVVEVTREDLGVTERVRVFAGEAANGETPAATPQGSGE